MSLINELNYGNMAKVSQKNVISHIVNRENRRFMAMGKRDLIKNKKQKQKLTLLPKLMTPVHS